LIQNFKTRIKFESLKDQPIIGASNYIKEQENRVGWYQAEPPFSLYSQITQDITILYNRSSGGQSGIIPFYFSKKKKEKNDPILFLV
jgi:hypothetical protein